MPAMKVIRVEYKGKERNLVVYDGMPPSEVHSLLSSCMQPATSGSQRASSQPRLLALRDTRTNTIIPLSIACKQWARLGESFQIIDEQQQGGRAAAGGAGTAGGQRGAAAPASSAADRSKVAQQARAQTARAATTGAAGGARVGGMSFSSSRPFSASPPLGSPSFVQPTPIWRHGEDAGAAWQAQAKATGPAKGQWGYDSSSVQSSPERAGPARNRKQAWAAPMQRQQQQSKKQPVAQKVHKNFNFVGAGYESSPVASADASPLFSAAFPSNGRGSQFASASPAFNLATSSPSPSPSQSFSFSPSSPLSSGIHVVLSYPELLDVLTGHTRPNINNGSTPRSVRMGRPVLFVLGVVRPGVESCERFFLHLQSLSLRPTYPNLVFLLMESVLLEGTSLEVDEEAGEIPVLQFFLHGHLLGQLVDPTLEQMESLLQSCDRLVEDNPDVSVEESEEEEEEEESEYEEEEEEEASLARQYASLSMRRSPSPRPYSLGEVLDEQVGWGELERRQLYRDVEDEEARWAQLLQPSPKRGSPSKRKRAMRSPSPSPSPSESEGSEAGFFIRSASPSNGLVIRGTKVTLHPAPPASSTTRSQQSASTQRQARPEKRLRDWDSYEEFNVEESAEEEEEEEDQKWDSLDDSEEEDAYARAYAGAKRADRRTTGFQATPTSARKRKQHPAASDEEHSESGHPIGAFSSAYSSLTVSPTLHGRAGPAHTLDSSSLSAGLLMAPQEAREIERLILRRDGDVKAAFEACPGLETLMDVFGRLVHFQINHPLPGVTPTNNNSNNQQAAAAGSASSGAAQQQQGQGVPQPPPSARKRKSHPVNFVTEAPKHKRNHVERQMQQAAAAAAARVTDANRSTPHKRKNSSVYEESEESEQEEDVSSEEEDSSERLLRARLASQNAQYDALQQQYLTIQNQLFSRSVHDLHSQGLLTDDQLQYVIYLWTETEEGSNAIRKLLKQYEEGGDEMEWLYAMVQLARRFEQGLPLEQEEEEQSPSGSEEEDDEEEDEEYEDDEEDDEEEEEEDEEDEDFEEEDEDDEEEEEMSPLNSDEEREYEALLRKFASEGLNDKETSDKEPEKPSSSPLPSASSTLDGLLSSHLSLLHSLGEHGLLAPELVSRAHTYLIHGHPLLQAALIAFQYNQDIEDLVDTINIVMEQRTQRREEEEEEEEEVEEESQGGERERAAAATLAASAAAPSSSSASSSPFPLHPSDLLALLPPYLVSSHGTLISHLVEQGDVVLLAAFDLLRDRVREGVAGPQLAQAVEDMVDTVERRVQAVLKEQEEKKNKKQQTAASTEEDEDASSSSPSLTDALQIASVLHTGGVFSDHETAVLWELILDHNPVISAAFDLAQEDEQWDELHDTLIRLLAKHQHLQQDSHPLVELVQQATGQIDEQDVERMQDMMKKMREGEKKGQQQKQQQQQHAQMSTPDRIRSSLPPAGTPPSPSIPRSAWSRTVSTFTTSIESLQSTNRITDEQALMLIDLFQARVPAILAACEVRGLEGEDGQDEFEETLCIIVQEKEEQDKKNKANKKHNQEESEEEEEEDADAAEDEEEEEEDDEDDYETVTLSPRDRLYGSGSASTQQQHPQSDADAAADPFEVDEESLAALLSKSDSDITEKDMALLYSKVLSMQQELLDLKQLQADRLIQAGLDPNINIDELLMNEEDEEEWEDDMQ